MKFTHDTKYIVNCWLAHLNGGAIYPHSFWGAIAPKHCHSEGPWVSNLRDESRIRILFGLPDEWGGLSDADYWDLVTEWADAVSGPEADRPPEWTREYWTEV